MYPSNLFQSMAKNLLSRLHGGQNLATILKEARPFGYELNKEAQTPLFSTVTPTTDEEVANMMNFLAMNNYKPEQFLDEAKAKALVKQRTDESIRRIDDLFQEQAKVYGGLTPEMNDNRKAMLASVEKTKRPAIMGEGIRNVMGVQQANPERFQELQTLSQRSKDALDQQSAPMWTGVTGALAGGLMGSAFGNTTSRRFGFGVPTAIASGIAGHWAGKKMAEQKTGYRYGDILGPVGIADRVSKQVNSDPRT